MSVPASHAAGRCRKRRHNGADPRVHRALGANFVAPMGTQLCRHNLRGDRRYLPGDLRFCSHSGCTGAAIPIAAMLPTCDFPLDLAICGPLGGPSRRPLLRLRPRHSNVHSRIKNLLLDGPHGLIACEAVPIACGRCAPLDRVQACGGSPHRHRCCPLGACAQCRG
jgi:hypothetical protein